MSAEPNSCGAIVLSYPICGQVLRSSACKQPWCEFPGRRHCGCLCDCLRISISGGQGRVLRCFTCKLSEAPSHLELAILTTEPFQLQSENLSRFGGERTAKCASRGPADQSSQGTADYRKGCFGCTLENSSQRIPHRRADKLANSAAGLLDEVAKKLLQFGLV